MSAGKLIVPGALSIRESGADGSQGSLGETLISRKNGVLVQGIDGAGLMPIAPLPLDWWTQRQLHASSVLNALGVQVDEPKRFDYSTISPGLGGAASPTRDTTKSGIVYSVTNGFLLDMPSPNTQQLIANPQAEAWYVARKCSYGAASVAGGQAVPVAMASPALANTYVEVAVTASTNTTHHFLLMDNGTGTPTQLDLGAQCAIGGALAPNGAPFTIALWYDLNTGTVNVTFQDVLVATVTASGGGLAKMPTSGLSPGASSSNIAAAMSCYAGFAMIKGATT